MLASIRTNRGEGLFWWYVSNLPLGQLSSPAIKGWFVCVCSGASQLGKKFKDSATQSTVRRDAHFTAGIEGKRKDKTRGKKGRRRGTEKCYRCYFNLDSGGESPRKLPTIP